MADLFASPVVELHARVDDKPPQIFRGRFAWTLDAFFKPATRDALRFPGRRRGGVIDVSAAPRRRRFHRNDR